MLDAGKSPHKVEVPVGAAKLAVGDKGQAGILLLLDKFGYALVLNLFEPGVVQLSGGMCGACGFKAIGTKKAADDIEASGCDGGHDWFLSLDALSDERSMRGRTSIGKYRNQCLFDRKNL